MSSPAKLSFGAVVSLVVVLLGAGFAQADENSMRPVKSVQLVYADYPEMGIPGAKHVVPLDNKDKRSVTFSPKANFKAGKVNCAPDTCYIFEVKQVGSSLVAEVIYSKGTYEPQTKFDVKIANIRGDGQIDFTVPAKFRLTGVRRAKLFCMDINVPTIGRSNNCSALPGRYDVELF